MSEQVVTVGRIVHYVLPGKGAIRPAIVVQVWPDGSVNLQVFTDGVNDGAHHASGLHWATSAHQSDTHEYGTWHWPPRS